MNAISKLIMNILQLIFSDFWVWLGTLILIGVTLDGIAEIIKACKK
jgi:hypothetical protein